MSAYAQNDIITVMQTPLASLTTIDSDQVAYINVEFSPTQGTPYIQAFMLSAEPRQASLGTNGLQQYDGIMQVDVNVPIGGGRTDVNPIMAEIMETFKRGTTLTNANISVKCKGAWESVPYDGEGWHTVPVNIRWYAYTSI